MRLASMLSAVAVLASSLALTPTPAHAQEGAPTSAMPACAGVYDLVRVSEIKPGQMKTFLDAVTAQQAWYKHMGLVDQIVLERVIDRDPKTKAYTVSDTTAITEHILGAVVSADRPQDEGYKAFVALFQASSTIKTSYMTCEVR